MSGRQRPDGTQEELIGRALMRLLMPLRGRMTARIKREGFTSSQYWVLQWSIAYAPTTPGRLASILNSSLPGITSALNQLEAGGYVTRRRGTPDRRQVMVQPTEKGRRSSRILKEILREIASEATAGMTGAERTQAARILLAMADGLGASTRAGGSGRAK